MTLNICNECRFIRSDSYLEEADNQCTIHYTYRLVIRVLLHKGQG